MYFNLAIYTDDIQTDPMGLPVAVILLIVVIEVIVVIVLTRGAALKQPLKWLQCTKEPPRESREGIIDTY